MRRVLQAAMLLLACLAGAGAAGAAGTADPSRPAPPPAAARWSLQLGGADRPASGVRIVDRDRQEPPVRGLYNLCYLNAFQAQSDELGWWRRNHRSLLLYAGHHPVIDQGWGEQLLDTSTPAKRARLATILGGWIDACARAGFQAVDPDNLDSWQRSNGQLNQRDNLALARLLIARAHADGLAIGQKNVPELAGTGRRMGFDFAVSEECQVYDECRPLLQAYGREVLEVEYSRAGFVAACRARGTTISVELRDLNLVPAGQRGHVERWCSRARP